MLTNSGSLVPSIPSSVPISEMVSRVIHGKATVECSFKFRVGMSYDCDRVKETGFFRGGLGTGTSFLTAEEEQPAKATQEARVSSGCQFLDGTVHHSSRAWGSYHVASTPRTKSVMDAGAQLTFISLGPQSTGCWYPPFMVGFPSLAKPFWRHLY